MAMSLRMVVLVAAGMASAACLLQGCGGGGDTPKPTPSPTPGPPSPTPPPTRPKPVTPMTSAEAAKYLNGQYTKFDEKDDTSPLGLTISMAANTSSFWGNIYCSKIENPIMGRTGCSGGRTDCRMSASLYNAKMLVSASTGKALLGLGRATGIVFNQTLVESRFARCSYIFDGASDRKYGVGCGRGAPGDCPGGAFANQCGAKHDHTCSMNDVEVTDGFCEKFGGKSQFPQVHSCTGCKSGAGPCSGCAGLRLDQCSFPGPAVNYTGEGASIDSELHGDFKKNLRDMAQKRVSVNKYTGVKPGDKDKPPIKVPNIEEWNEVVIDERLLIPSINEHPVETIPAIVYVKDTTGQNRKFAIAMRDQYCDTVGLDTEHQIPLVAIDTNKKATDGPFVADSEEQIEIV